MEEPRPGYVRNPRTGRWIKRTGRLARQIFGEPEPEPEPMHQRNLRHALECYAVAAADADWDSAALALRHVVDVFARHLDQHQEERDLALQWIWDTAVWPHMIPRGLWPHLVSVACLYAHNLRDMRYQRLQTAIRSIAKEHFVY